MALYSTAGLDNMEKRIFSTVPRSEIWLLCCPGHSHSLYWLSHSSSYSTICTLTNIWILKTK
jgi:hypothetical protein